MPYANLSLADSGLFTRTSLDKLISIGQFDVLYG